MGRRYIAACTRLGFSVTLMSDRNERSRNAASELVPTSRFASPEEVATDASLDLVIVSTTTPGHCELGSLAVASGRPFVMIEKPLGRSVKECDDLIEACRQSSSKVAVNHPYRHIRQYQDLIELVRSDDFGGVSSLHVSGGSGGIAMLGTHLLDLFAMLGGGAVSHVEGRFPVALSPNPRGAEYEDVTGVLRCWSILGKRFSLDLSHDQGTGMLATVAGPSGICTFDMLNGEIHHRMRRPEQRGESPSKYMLGVSATQAAGAPISIVDGTTSHLKSLVDGKHICTPEEARSYVEIIVAAIQSSRQMQTLAIGDGSIDRNERFDWP